MTTLNHTNAEILEFVVKKSSKVNKQLIKKIDFPRTATIGGVVRDGKGIIALGDFKIQEGDKVVVCALSTSIKRVEKLFK